MLLTASFCCGTGRPGAREAGHNQPAGSAGQPQEERARPGGSLRRRGAGREEEPEAAEAETAAAAGCVERVSDNAAGGCPTAGASGAAAGAGVPCSAAAVPRSFVLLAAPPSSAPRWCSEHTQRLSNRSYTAAVPAGAAGERGSEAADAGSKGAAPTAATGWKRWKCCEQAAEGRCSSKTAATCQQRGSIAADAGAPESTPAATAGSAGCQPAGQRRPSSARGRGRCCCSPSAAVQYCASAQGVEEGSTRAEAGSKGGAQGPAEGRERGVRRFSRHTLKLSHWKRLPGCHATHISH